MAIFSSHLLDATNGSHAGNIDVIIYQIKKNGDKEIFCESKSDDGGRIHKEFDLSDPNGDCTFRRIPYDTNYKDLIITHKYYDHYDADRDPNLILPIEVLSELQSEGIVGPSCENHYSFMGHIEEPHLKTLIQKSSVEAAKEIRQQKADIALLVPA